MRSLLTYPLACAAMAVALPAFGGSVSEYESFALTNTGATDRTGQFSVDTALGANSYIVIGLAGETPAVGPLSVSLAGPSGTIDLTNSVGGTFDTGDDTVTISPGSSVPNPQGNWGNAFLFYAPVSSLDIGTYDVTIGNGQTFSVDGTGATIPGKDWRAQAWLVTDVAGVRDVAWEAYRDDDNGPQPSGFGGGAGGNVGFNLDTKLNPIAQPGAGVSDDADLSLVQEGDLALSLFYAGSNVGTGGFATQVTGLLGGLQPNELNFQIDSSQFSAASGTVDATLDVGGIFDPGYFRSGIAAIAFEPMAIMALLGDMNDDGAVNGLDISPFVLALTDLPGYQSQFPQVDPLAVGDLNMDGLINGLDIQPFVDLLTGTSDISTEMLAPLAAIPEPASMSLLALGGLALRRRR